MSKHLPNCSQVSLCPGWFWPIVIILWYSPENITTFHPGKAAHKSNVPWGSRHVPQAKRGLCESLNSIDCASQTLMGLGITWDLVKSRFCPPSFLTTVLTDTLKVINRATERANARFLLAVLRSHRPVSNCDAEVWLHWWIWNYWWS